MHGHESPKFGAALLFVFIGGFLIGIVVGIYSERSLPPSLFSLAEREVSISSEDDFLADDYLSPRTISLEDSAGGDFLSDFVITPTDWKEYTSDNFGFSVQLPQQVYDSTLGTELPLTVYEKENNITAYIATTDPRAVGAKNYESIKSGLDRGWTITIVPVKNETELDAFAKEFFGPTCEVEELFARTQTGHLGVEIGGPDSCIILADISVIYSPDHEKIAAGFARQDYVFTRGTEGQSDFESFDSDIIESFHFIK